MVCQRVLEWTQIPVVMVSSRDEGPMRSFTQTARYERGALEELQSSGLATRTQLQLQYTGRTMILATLTSRSCAPIRFDRAKVAPELDPACLVVL